VVKYVVSESRMHKSAFYFITAFLIAIGTGALATIGGVYWSFLVVAGLIFIFVSFYKPLYGFYVVLVACVFTRYPVDIFGFAVRADQIAIMVLLPIFVFRKLVSSKLKKGERSEQTTLLNYEDLFLIGWLAVNYLASALNAEEPSRSFRICAWITISAATFLLTRYVSNKYLHPLRLLQVFMILGVAEALYGLLAYLSANMFGTTIGVQVDPITKYIGAYGTMWEANIFGSFTMGICLLSLGYMLGERKRPYVYAGMFLIAVMAMITSMTRGAWLGFAIGIVFLFFRTGLIGTFMRHIITIILVMVLVVGFIIAAGYTEQVVSRITTALDYTSGSISYRLSNIKLAFEDWVQNPVIGLGTNSFGQRHLDPTRNAPGYIGSLLMQSLYDSGIIGLIMLCGFFGSMFIRLHRVYQAQDTETRGIVAGFTAAIIGLFIAYQATSALWFGYNWILFGICSGLSRTCHRKRNFI